MNWGLKIFCCKRIVNCLCAVNSSFVASISGGILVKDELRLNL